MLYSQRIKEIRSEDQLFQIRHDVAKALIATPPAQLQAVYKGDLGQAHATLLSVGVTDYPIPPQEQPQIDSLVQHVSQGPPGSVSINQLLAAMLYKGPHQLLACELLPTIPAWLLDDILKYALSQPRLFKDIGECELFCQHLSRWVNYLHTNILSNPTQPFWRVVLHSFMTHVSFIPLYFSWNNPREIYRQRGELIEYGLKLWGYRPDFEFTTQPKASGKIRYGVLMLNFMPRAETFATLPMYSHVDRQKIEVTLISYASREKSAMDDYCISYADRFVEISDDINQSVKAIRDLDLDALWIGTNVGARINQFTNLCAHRLARVQLAGGCSPTTLGLRNIDAFVSGTLTEPENAQEHYTEKLLCLDGPVICFDFGPEKNNAVTQKTDRAKLNIPGKAVVFASGANYFKIIPELEELWIRTLAATPNSWLLLYPFNPNWTKTYPSGPFTQRMFATCKRLGVDQHRLVIVPPLPDIADIRNMLGNVADVYLDSFPHSGMTSLIDPWLTGVPTVVLEGNSQRSRMASGALRDMGIPELIAENQEAYLQLAARLGTDKDFRRQMAERIRQQIAKPPKFLDPKWGGEEMTRVLQKLLP
jgi:hypothetical protein